MIERLARLREPDLPPAAIAYTRRVTQVWCVFFAVNGAIALYHRAVRLVGALVVLQWLSGLLFMGLLFAGEYCVRPQAQTSHHG